VCLGLRGGSVASSNCLEEEFNDWVDEELYDWPKEDKIEEGALLEIESPMTLLSYLCLGIPPG